nr:lysosomal acid lipase/cholesteryl ester hydrolase-like [Leptinotarsa decemlineata]
MGHGIYMNSLGFVVMSNKSIAYQLLVRGHPVFLVNFRGSKYSTSHKTLAKNDSAYWKFSFHQMAQYDLPVVMNLVAQKTGGAKAVYIGFSMGTTVINIYCILYPQEATKRLVGVIEMAPVANLTKIRSIVGILSPSWPILKPIANSIWHGILLPRNDYLKEFCSTHVIVIFLCYTITAFVFGANYAMLDPLRMPVVMQQCPDVISTMVVDHYYQIIRHKQFLQYDYGYEQNIEKYGSPFPHPYNFSEIKVPITLFVGLNDFVAEAKNSRILYNNLPSTSRCGFKVIPDSHWTHDAFVFSKDMHLYLNNEILNTIPIMENNLCSQYRHD